MGRQFGLEYILRIASYRPPPFEIFQQNFVSTLQVHIRWRVRYAFHPLNLIDLLTILGGTPELRGLRGLRALRLLRLFKSTKLFRYSNPFYGLINSFEKNELLYFMTFGFVALITLTGGVSIFLIENKENVET